MTRARYTAAEERAARAILVVMFPRRLTRAGMRFGNRFRVWRTAPMWARRGCREYARAALHAAKPKRRPAR